MNDIPQILANSDNLECAAYNGRLDEENTLVSSLSISEPKGQQKLLSLRVIEVRKRERNVVVTFRRSVARYRARASKGSGGGKGRRVQRVRNATKRRDDFL